MACYNVQYPERKVYNNQEIFVGLKFNLSFITDKEARDKMLKFYWNWSMVYPDKNFMNVQLQNWIDMSRDYWEDMARTYKYEYDPLVNIDLTETRTYTKDNKANSSSTSTNNGTSTYSEVPYDKNFEKERNQNKQTGTATGKSDGTANEIYTETSTKKGDASLRSIPEFIKIERSILDSLITNYISYFKDFFYLDI